MYGGWDVSIQRPNASFTRISVGKTGQWRILKIHRQCAGLHRKQCVQEFDFSLAK